MTDTLTLTNPIPVAGEGGSGEGGGSGAFYVTITEEYDEEKKDNVFFIDKTYNELRAAVNDGAVVIGKDFYHGEHGEEIELRSLVRLTYIANSVTPYTAVFDNIELFATTPDETMNSIHTQDE